MSMTEPASSPGTEAGTAGSFGEEAAALFAELEGGEESGGGEDAEPGDGESQGGDTETDGLEEFEGEYVPKGVFKRRLNEVIAQRNEAQKAAEGLQGYQPLIQALEARLGITAEAAGDLAERIMAGEISAEDVAEAAGDPNSQQQSEPNDLASFVERVYGMDVHSLTEFELRTAQREFQREQQQAQQTREAERERVLDAISRDFDTLLPDFPLLKSPRLQTAFLNEYGQRHGHRPNAAAMRKHAEEFTAELTTLGRNQLSEAALAEARSAQGRPNTGGGQSPGNEPDTSFLTDRSPTGEAKFSKAVRDFFGGAMRR